MHFISVALSLTLLSLCANGRDPRFVQPRPAGHSDYEPQQIHIGFGQRITDIVIIWATKKNDTSRVEYISETDNVKVL